MRAPARREFPGWSFILTPAHDPVIVVAGSCQRSRSKTCAALRELELEIVGKLVPRDLHPFCQSVQDSMRPAQHSWSVRKLLAVAKVLAVHFHQACCGGARSSQPAMQVVTMHSQFAQRHTSEMRACLTPSQTRLR